MMATPQNLNKLPDEYRPRTNAVLNITTPEVQPNFGKFQRNSAKEMLVNVHDESAKSLGKKLKRAQVGNPVVDPNNVDKKMLRRGIYSDPTIVNERMRSATCAPLIASHTTGARSTASLPHSKARRASLPAHGGLTQQPSLNGSPQGPAYILSHGQSLDSGVVMETTEPVPPRSRALSNSSDDLTEHRPRTATTQVQFPLSLASNHPTMVVHDCTKSSGHVLNQDRVCVVCDVLRNEPVDVNSSFADHLVTDQRNKALHSRDSGVGNELHSLSDLSPDVHTPTIPLMLSTDMLNSPSKGLGMSRSTEMPATESRTVHLRTSSVREKDFFETTNDLAKESAHFVMADLLIAATEECKCLNQEKLMEVEYRNEPLQDATDSNVKTPQQTVSQPGIVQAEVALSSAEHTAHQLLRHIKELMASVSVAGSSPASASSVFEHITSSLSSNHPQLLGKAITCNRGDEQWAPPRQQVIFTIPPHLKRHDALLQQGYRCHGCGMKVDRDLSKHFRYCNYSGKYFCLSCHSNAQDVIPAMVLNKWVFKRYPISNYAKAILDKTRNVPTFFIDTIKPGLYNRCAQLSRTCHIRQQLVAVRKYLLTCKFAEELHERLTHMNHLTFDVHSYSLADLIAVNAGQIQRPLQNILVDSIKHIRMCDLCKQRGFICEFCKNQKDILYPFELDKIVRCACHACFHRECYVREKCPRCLRLKLRQQQRNCVDYDSP